MDRQGKLDMAQESSHTTLDVGYSDQGLVTSKSNKKRNMIIGGVVVAVIIVLVVTLSVTLTGRGSDEEEPTTTPSPTTTTPITTTTTPITTTTTTETPDPPFIIDPEEIEDERFTPDNFGGSDWISGNSIMTRNQLGNLIVIDIEENINTTWVENGTAAGDLLQRSKRFLQMNPEQSHIAFAYDVIPVYRHSFLGHYAVVAKGDEPIHILPPSSTRDETEGALQNLVWGPSGNALAFVYKNNIFYMSSLLATPEQITESGEVGLIYNGIPDWVYEEEVFSSNNAIWFSSDGSRMAYATFDDRDVRIMKVPHYGVPGNILYQYTAHHAIRYPKAGTVNPTVTVTLLQLGTTTSNTFEAPLDLDQPILLSVTFATNTQLALVWANRVQNQMIVQLCTTSCSTIFSYNEPAGWIDNNPLVFNAAGNAFLTILPQTVNGRRYKQVVQVSEGATPDLQWTIEDRSHTAHTVLDIYLWTTENVIWYKATGVDDSAEQHLFKVNGESDPECFTCSVKRSDGTDCLYNEAIFSSDGSRMTINCAGPRVPQVFVYEATGELVHNWALNYHLSEEVERDGFPVIKHYEVPLGDGILPAQVQLQLPFDYDARTDIPLLVYVYAGPDTALVTHQWWPVDWGTSLVTRYGVAIAHIDGRGSGLRGVENMFSVNRNLGTLEVEDQITVARYLKENLSWLSNDRACIWGWSYGGYAASLALARGTDVFRCAVAVAPVTDWRFYDTIYTERYMDVPENNTEGYTQSSLINEVTVESFRNHRYFLIHGTADDNVHYQHAMVLSRLLQRRNVYFNQMSYTDEDHGLVSVRLHLYRGIERFLKENLGL